MRRSFPTTGGCERCTSVGFADPVTLADPLTP
jgi:hypothetical protein